MDKQKNKNVQVAKTTITGALISGILTLLSACIGVLFSIISVLPEVQKLSIPPEAITFITIVLSILVLAVILITAATTYIRTQTKSANMSIVKLTEKENQLFQEIDNEISALIAEKV